jgi:hypothetical protein
LKVQAASNQIIWQKQSNTGRAARHKVINASQIRHIHRIFGLTESSISSAQWVNVI